MIVDGDLLPVEINRYQPYNQNFEQQMAYQPQMGYQSPYPSPYNYNPNPNPNPYMNSPGIKPQYYPQYNQNTYQTGNIQSNYTPNFAAQAPPQWYLILLFSPPTYHHLTSIEKGWLSPFFSGTPLPVFSTWVFTLSIYALSTSSPGPAAGWSSWYCSWELIWFSGNCPRACLSSYWAPRSAGHTATVRTFLVMPFAFSITSAGQAITSAYFWRTIFEIRTLNKWNHT